MGLTNKHQPSKAQTAKVLCMYKSYGIGLKFPKETALGLGIRDWGIVLVSLALQLHHREEFQGRNKQYGVRNIGCGKPSGNMFRRPSRISHLYCRPILDNWGQVVYPVKRPGVLLGPKGWRTPKVGGVLESPSRRPSRSPACTAARKRGPKRAPGAWETSQTCRNKFEQDKQLEKEKDTRWQPKPPGSVIISGRYGPVKSLETGATWCQRSLVCSPCNHEGGSCASQLSPGFCWTQAREEKEKSLSKE